MTYINENINDLSPIQKIIGNILFFVGIGGFVIYTFVVVISLDYPKVGMLFGGFYTMIAFVLISVSFVQINSVLMWTGWWFCTIALVCLLPTIGVVSFGAIYPLLAGSFGIASMLTTPFSVYKRLHAYVVAIFGILCVILLLGALGVIGYLWVLLMLLIYVAMLITYVVLWSKGIIKKMQISLTIGS
ncbi:MAG: hypothetical protein FWF56_06785 [Firmicutes bacterium]|nr:hypothetical protein [Bacillota bacterium]MCL1953850.1 hypothetical protein [Bacillota bacterium]